MIRKISRIFAVYILLLTVAVTKASASSSSHSSSGRKSRLTYRQRLHAEYEKLSNKDQALRNIVVQYRRKKQKACPENIENRCELYKRKLQDAHRIHKGIIESKMAIKEELIMSEDDPEAEEFDDEVKVVQEDNLRTKANREAAAHDEFSVY